MLALDLPARVDARHLGSHPVHGGGPHLVARLPDARQGAGNLLPASTADPSSKSVLIVVWFLISLQCQRLGSAPQMGVGEVRLALRSFQYAVHLNPADRELRTEDLAWAHRLLGQKLKLETETCQNQSESTSTSTTHDDRSNRILFRS